MMIFKTAFLRKAARLLCLSGIALMFTLKGFGQSPRSVVDFDKGWHFHLGDVTDAQKPAFADADWRTLNLPHDWSIEGTFSKDNPASP